MPPPIYNVVIRNSYQDGELDVYCGVVCLYVYNMWAEYPYRYVIYYGANMTEHMCECWLSGQRSQIVNMI